MSREDHTNDTRKDALREFWGWLAIVVVLGIVGLMLALRGVL